MRWAVGVVVLLSCEILARGAGAIPRDGSLGSELLAQAPPRSVPADDVVFEEATIRRAHREAAGRTVDEAPEESAFAERAERYARIEAFNRRMASLEAQAFDVEADRYAELAITARRLEVEHAQEEAREFEQRLSLALRVQRFMHALFQRTEAAPAPRGAGLPAELATPDPQLAPEPANW